MGKTTLTWEYDGLAGEGFKIYRADSPMNPENLPLPIATVGIEDREYIDETVVDNETYYYRLASYSGDAERLSGEIEHIAEQGDPFSPIDIAPVLWLDAADSGSTTLVSGAVTNWQNKGNALGDFSQATASARPLMVESALADLPVVRFDGSNDRLTSSDTALRSMFTNTGNGWAFVVFCRRGTSSKIATVFRSSTSNGAAGRFAFYAGANIAGYYNSASLVARRLDSDSVSVIRSPVSYGTDWTMALSRADWDTGEMSIIVDGGAPTVGALGTTGTTANTLSADVVLGAEGFTSYGDIDLAELTAGSGTHLTQSNIDKLFGYAAWKWGLVGKLPEDHPYKHQSPMKSPA